MLSTNRWRRSEHLSSKVETVHFGSIFEFLLRQKRRGTPDPRLSACTLLKSKSPSITFSTSSCIQAIRIHTKTHMLGMVEIENPSTHLRVPFD